ncbi:hypothetical protein ISCU110981_20075 [Isoptericola cucumis]
MKYVHHRPNVSPVPASATSAASTLQPCVSTTADSDATVPMTPSPRVMIARSPYRSAMWCGCHGVPRRPSGPAGSRSATQGPAVSTRISTPPTAKNVPTETGATASTTHPTCDTTSART